MTGISTKRVYYDNTYLDKLEAKVVEIGQDENGGGQPNDEGYFEINDKQHPITKLIAPRNPYQEPYLIKHYYEGKENFQKGEKVIQLIDMKKRLLFARYHSAGHLLSLAVNQLYPELDGYKGNHFPGQAFVVFEGNLPSDFSLLREKVSNLVNELLLYKN
jgi:alanyl-tRNA synthetase